MIKKTLAVGAAVATGLSGFAVAAAVPANAASTYYACVKKSGGQTKIVKKKTKCKKGWKKVKWSAKGVPGGTGPQGAPGAPLAVKDATGAVVGQFMGTWSGLVPGFTVLIDGGLWEYENDGVLDASSSSPYFTSNTCESPVAWVEGSSAAETAEYLKSYVPNGLGRQVYRPDNVGAAARAWKVAGPNTPAFDGQDVYQLDSSGTCVLENAIDAGDVANAATFVSLADVTPPANRPGPLTVG